MEENLEIIWHKSHHFISEVKRAHELKSYSCPGQTHLKKSSHQRGIMYPNCPLLMANVPPSVAEPHSGGSSYLLSTFSQYYINCLNVQILMLLSLNIIWLLQVAFIFHY